MTKPVLENVYNYRRRGETTRNLVAWGANVGGVGGGRTFRPQAGTTIAGGTLVSNNSLRTYFEFQNNSVADDMVLQLGRAPASASDGIVVIPGGAERWEISVPTDDIYVFCANANQPFTFLEA